MKTYKNHCSILRPTKNWW